MLLKLVVLGLISFILTSESFAQDSTFDSTSTSKKIEVLKIQKSLKQQEINAMNEKIKTCSEVLKTRLNANCAGFWEGSKTEADIKQWNEDLKKLNTQAKEIDDSLTKEGENTRLNAASILKVNGMQLQSKYLLMDMATLKAELGGTAYNAQAMMAAMDRTLLGEYTKYAIEKSLNSDEMKKSVCEAVKTCSDTKKTHSAINGIKTQMKSFEQFKKETLQAAQSSSVKPSSSPPSSGNGAQ